MEDGAVVIASLSPLIRSRLEKAALDNGFDQELPAGGCEPNWIGFASTRAPLWIWLTTDASGAPLVALSQAKVASALAPLVRETGVPVPQGARAIVGVADLGSLHGVLRRAFQLSRSLPDAPLRVFEAKTKHLPRGTEIERLVVQRIGQDTFRESLLEYWEGRCAVTGLAVPALLRASHIKPWAECTSDAERLDVHNGLLLAPHLDAAFDGGFITVADDGAVVVSAELDARARACLGLGGALRVSALSEQHRAYLVWHRQRIYRSEA